MYFSPVAFRWSPLRSRAENHGRLTFLGSPNSQFATRFSFAVERLRDRCRTTNFAQKQDFHFEIAAFSLDVQHVTRVDFAGRLSSLMIALNPAEIACARCQTARFKKARCPQPFIDTNSRHDFA